MTSDPGGFYDRFWAERPVDLNDEELARLAEIGRLIVPLLPLQGGILEVGCGTGWLSAWLSRWGPVRGLDASPEAITQARSRHPGLTFETIAESGDLGTAAAARLLHSDVRRAGDRPGAAQLARRRRTARAFTCRARGADGNGAAHGVER